jgi:HEAT repeat protein
MRQVALAVLEELGKRNDPQIVRILAPHVDDDDRPIRGQVISLLGRFGHLDPVLARARLEFLTNDGWRPQRGLAAMEALAAIERKLAGGEK